MDTISVQQIKDYLQANNIDGDVIQLRDTMGNQQLFRVKIRGEISLRQQKEITQIIQNQFHTKVTDIRFITENMHYDYNGSHMLVYDIERKYNNIYSGKLQVAIDDQTYGYDVLFDDMKGIVEWDRDHNEINQEHITDGTSKDFKGLIDMFNIDLQNHVNIERHVKKNPKSSKNRKKKKEKIPQILINYDQSRGLISYVLIKDLELGSTTFNKLVQELASQSLYVTYKKRENEYDDVPSEVFIGRSGSSMSENDMVNLTKVLSKNGVNTSDYQYVNVQNLSLLPTSALIKLAIKQDGTTTAQ